MDPSIKCKPKLNQLEAADYEDQTLSLQFRALAVEATASLPSFTDQSSEQQLLIEVTEKTGKRVQKIEEGRDIFQGPDDVLK